MKEKNIIIKELSNIKRYINYSFNDKEKSKYLYNIGISIEQIIIYLEKYLYYIEDKIDPVYSKEVDNFIFEFMDELHSI